MVLTVLGNTAVKNLDNISSLLMEKNKEEQHISTGQGNDDMYFIDRLIVMCLLVLGLVEDVCEAALAAVLAVKVGGHEDTCTTLLVGALTAQTGNLAVLVNLDVTQHRLMLNIST